MPRIEGQERGCGRAYDRETSDTRNLKIISIFCEMAMSSASASMMLHIAIYSLIMAGIPALSPAKNMASSAKALGPISESGVQTGMKVAAAASIAVQLGDSWPRPSPIEEAAIKALEQHLPPVIRYPTKSTFSVSVSCFFLLPSLSSL